MNSCTTSGLLVAILVTINGIHETGADVGIFSKCSFDAKFKFCRIACVLRRGDETCFVLENGKTVTTCVHDCLQFLGENLSNAKQCTCKNGKCVNETATTTTKASTTAKKLSIREKLSDRNQKKGSSEKVSANKEHLDKEASRSTTSNLINKGAEENSIKEITASQILSSTTSMNPSSSTIQE